LEVSALKKLYFILLPLMILACLTACSPGPAAAPTVSPAAPEVSPTVPDVTELQPPEVTDNTPVEEDFPEPPSIVMLEQAYSDTQVIEVPQLVSKKTSAALDEINRRILEFAGDYEQYLNASDSTEWLELKCYPVLNEKYIQLVMTRIVYPNYGTYGEIFSICYDYQEDKELTLAEIIRDNDLDLVNPENKLLNVLPEGIAPESFSPDAAVESQEGDMFFYTVYLRGPDEDTRKDLYIRYPDGSYDLYNFDKLYFGLSEGELVPMTPPLYWEQ
jgi:hypothetical protein